MFFYEAFHGLLCLELLFLGMSNIYNAGIEHFSGFINNGDFASRSVTGVESEGTLTLDGRLEQKFAQVHIEHLECGFNRAVGYHIAYFALDRWEYKSVICVGGSVTHGIGAG